MNHTVVVRVLASGIGVFCKDDVQRLDNGARDSWRMDELADLADQHIQWAETGTVPTPQSGDAPNR